LGGSFSLNGWKNGKKDRKFKLYLTGNIELHFQPVVAFKGLSLMGTFLEDEIELKLVCFLCFFIALDVSRTC